MKVHKIELLIVDHDEVGIDEIKDIIENIKYPNWCMSPQVMQTATVNIGKWDDDLPINKTDTIKAEYNRLFNQ